MTDESAQLLAYAQTGSEDAFAALVQRYLPLVYASALRRVGGDAHRAQDVTQMVFVALARNAASLARHPNLIGWLFTTTRFLGAKARHAEERQRTLPREAEMITPDPSLVTNEASEQLHSILDDLVAELKEIDRRAILLRFYRGLRLAEIGRELGLSENAAQKRLERTLEQLKDKLSRRGVTSTAAAVALALEAQSMIAVPAGLAAASTGAAVATSAIGSGLLGSLGLAALTKFQAALLAALLLAGSGGLIWQHVSHRRQQEEAQRQSDTLRQQLGLERERNTAAENRIVVLQEAIRAAQAAGANQTPTVELIDPRNLVTAIIDRARLEIRDRKFQTALDEYMEGYRTLRQVRRGGTESGQLLGAIASLGKSSSFPPALITLRQLRDDDLQQFDANALDGSLAIEIATINRYLDENDVTIRLFDSLPPGSSVRQSLGIIATDAFVAARRYDDVLTGRNFGQMLNEFEMKLQNFKRFTALNPTETRSLLNLSTDATRTAMRDIEALAGAGRREDARLLAEKVLAFDNSESTRALIKEHLDRAGQPAASGSP